MIKFSVGVSNSQKMNPESVGSIIRTNVHLPCCDLHTSNLSMLMLNIIAVYISMLALLLQVLYVNMHLANATLKNYSNTLAAQDS